MDEVVGSGVGCRKFGGVLKYKLRLQGIDSSRIKARRRVSIMAFRFGKAAQYFVLALSGFTILVVLLFMFNLFGPLDSLREKPMITAQGRIFRQCQMALEW